MVTFANIFLIAYSTTAVAFFGAYFKAQQMVVMTVNGLIQGCIPVMSFNFGAKNRQRLQKAFHCGTVIAVIMMGAGALLLSVFPAQILKIFMASDDMLELGIPALRIMAVSYTHLDVYKRQTHLNEKITLSMLSQKFYMSESAISSYIRNTTGLSFFDLLNEMRVGKDVYKRQTSGHCRPAR